MDRSEKIVSSVCVEQSKKCINPAETILYFQQYSANWRKTFWNEIYKKQFPDFQIKLLCNNLKQNKISPGPSKSQLEPVSFRHFNKSFDPLAQFPKFCTTEKQIWSTGDIFPLKWYSFVTDYITCCMFCILSRKTKGSCFFSSRSGSAEIFQVNIQN